jgi:hypothetical protein
VIPLHWYSHFGRLHCSARNFENHHFENDSFWSRLVVGIRTPQILNEGAFHQYRRLAEGLVYFNRLVSSFQVFLFGRYCQKCLKNARFLATIFCDFLAIFVHFCGFGGDTDLHTHLYWWCHMYPILSIVSVLRNTDGFDTTPLARWIDNSSEVLDDSCWPTSYLGGNQLNRLRDTYTYQHYSSSRTHAGLDLCMQTSVIGSNFSWTAPGT